MGELLEQIITHVRLLLGLSDCPWASSPTAPAQESMSKRVLKISIDTRVIRASGVLTASSPTAPAQESTSKRVLKIPIDTRVIRASGVFTGGQSAGSGGGMGQREGQKISLIFTFSTQKKRIPKIYTHHTIRPLLDIFSAKSDACNFFSLRDKCVRNFWRPEKPIDSRIIQAAYTGPYSIRRNIYKGPRCSSTRHALIHVAQW